MNSVTSVGHATDCFGLARHPRAVRQQSNAMRVRLRPTALEATKCRHDTINRLLKMFAAVILAQRPYRSEVSVR
jgi:hypothetical protein